MSASIFISNVSVCNIKYLLQECTTVVRVRQHQGVSVSESLRPGKNSQLSIMMNFQSVDMLQTFLWELGEIVVPQISAMQIMMDVFSQQGRLGNFIRRF